MIVSEVALSFVLLLGSGLMVRSFLALSRTDPGFDPRHVSTLRVNGGRQGARPEENAAIVRQIHDALAAIPGVEAVTAANVLSLTENYFPYRWGTAEAKHDESRYQAFDVETVLPGYFATMHTPIVAGREFDESDNHPGLNRLIVDDVLAAKAFPHGNAGGQRILSRFRTVRPEWYEMLRTVFGVISSWPIGPSAHAATRLGMPSPRARHWRTWTARFWSRARRRWTM